MILYTEVAARSQNSTAPRRIIKHGGRLLHFKLYIGMPASSQDWQGEVHGHQRENSKVLTRIRRILHELDDQFTKFACLQ